MALFVRPSIRDFLRRSNSIGTVWAPFENASFCCSVFYSNVSEVQGSFNFDSSTFEEFFNSLVDLILVKCCDALHALSDIAYLKLSRM